MYLLKRLTLLVYEYKINKLRQNNVYNRTCKALRRVSVCSNSIKQTKLVHWAHNNLFLWVPTVHEFTLSVSQVLIN